MNDKQFSVQLSKSDIVRPILILAGFLAIFWGLEIFDWLTGDFFYLDGWGVRPRRLDSLPNIFFSPFLHGGFGHVAANSIPFAVLGALIMLRDDGEFWAVTFITTVISGLGIWLTGGPNSIHIGASGVVFGYFGYLLLLSYFERSIASIATSLIVLFLYGGLLWGVLPLQSGVSWQGHLFGFIGGIVAAYFLARRAASHPSPTTHADEIENEIKIL